MTDGSIPSENTWTIAGLGDPWISQDWVTNVLMAWIHQAGGTFGPTLLSLAFGAIVVLAFLVLWDAVRRRHPESSTIGRVLSLGAGLVVAAPVLGVRAQSVDVLWIAVSVWLLWGYVADRRMRWLVGLPLLAVAWANTHAAWPLLFALGGSVVVGELIDRLLRREVGPRPPLSTHQLGALAVALVVCGPALLLNPNGADLLTYPFTTANITAHRDFLFEWSPPDIATFPGQAMFGFLAVVVVPTLLIGRRDIRAAEVLWLLGLSILALSAIRFVIAIGPVGGAVAAVALAPALARLTRRHGLARTLGRIDRPPRTAALSRLNLVLAVLIAAGGVAAAVTRVAPGQQARAIAEAMPVRATTWLAAERPAGRIFNVYAWGGYLGRELPAAAVYIDGRSDIYGDGPIREYAEAIALERDPFPLLDRHAIEVIVFWPDTAFASALNENGDWERVYDDDQAAIWFRRDPG